MTSDFWKSSLLPLYEGRAYHNTRHLQQCLNEFAQVRHLCQDPDAVEAAIWFHDAVYVIGRHDNEEQSVGLAQKMLKETGADQAFAERVASLILDTKHTDPARSGDGRILADIDLYILAAPAAEYDQYARAIREEYRSVPDDAYRQGRIRVLQSFLSRARIYQSEHFHEKYEPRARDNLQREIEWLSKEVR